MNDENGTVDKYIFYDDDGKRIKKIVPDTGETTIFVYDASNRLVAEYSTVVEPSQTAKISYLTNDHLGSPRIITDENGMIVSRRDFMPFGEEIYTPERTQNLGYGQDDIRQKFTGYERDSETDLDFAQARYFNSGFGRFSSPDPLAASATTVSPQSWNRYIYAYNCPLRFNDPSGMIPGDYYNQDGDYLGWDGANDDNIYIVTNKKEKKLIRKNEEKGGSTQLSKVSSAVKLPSLKVRQAVGAAVERTRNPTADDKKGNHHEEAFVAGPSVEDGKEMIVDAPSGPFADLDDPKVAKAESDPFGGDPNELAQLADVTVIVHTHPGGATSSSTTNLSSPGKTVIGSLGGGRFFDPSPDNSPTDLPNAMQYERAFPKATFIVAAVGNNTAYIYNGSGTRATFPLDTFTTLTTRKH